jgi:hypothetical protein
MSSFVAAMIRNDAATRALRAERAVVAGQLRGVIDSSHGLRTDSGVVGVHPGVMYCTSNVSLMIDELNDRVTSGLEAIQSLREENARLQREIEVERSIKKEDPVENTSSTDLVLELKKRGDTMMVSPYLDKDEVARWLARQRSVELNAELKGASSRTIVHELKTRDDYLKALRNSLSPQDIALLARAKGIKGFVEAAGYKRIQRVPRDITATAVIEKRRRSARLAVKDEGWA